MQITKTKNINSLNLLDKFKMAAKYNNTSKVDDLDFPQDMSSDMEVYIVMGLLTFLSIVGTAGNALVLYVFSKKRDKLVSTLFILVMAFVDFVTCLIVIPYTIVLEYLNFYVKYDFACKLYQFLITSNIPFSALVMVAIAIDRYLCICHPFLHALNIARAKVMVGFLAVFSICVGIIVALIHGVTTYEPVEIDQLVESIDNNTHYYSTEHQISSFPNTSQMFVMDLELSNSTQANILQTETSRQHNKSSHFEYLYTGQCGPTTALLGETFQWYYQKIYTAMFLVCLIIVIVLYILIYKSVLERRTKRMKQKSKALPLINTATQNNTAEETLITNTNGDGSHVETTVIAASNGSMQTKESQRMLKESKSKNSKRKSTKKDKSRMANLKTAAMLFVVTVVFVVTFLPAFLMANEYIPTNAIIFYMYFANNVANPVIYSFMNKNFRDDLRKIFSYNRR